jgi:hypothetical protein
MFAHSPKMRTLMTICPLRHAGLADRIVSCQKDTEIFYQSRYLQHICHLTRAHHQFHHQPPQSIHLLHASFNIFERLAMSSVFFDNTARINVHLTIQKKLLICPIFPTFPPVGMVHHSLTTMKPISTLFRTKTHSY